MGWEHDVIETIDLTEHFSAEIRYDDSPMNPRTDYDPLTRIVYFERNARQEARTTEILPEYAIGERDLITLIRYLRIFHGAEVALIRGYVHSGTALTTVPVGDRGKREGMLYGQFTDRWDSMWWGLAFITRDDLIENFAKDGIIDVDMAQKCMAAEVDELESWINGSVYGYTIVANEDFEDDDLVPDFAEGSCWGFFGWDHEASGLKEQAMSEAEWCEELLAKQRADDALEEEGMRVTELGLTAA